MKIFRVELSNAKMLKKLALISEKLNFFDIGLVTANTKAFTIKDIEEFLKCEELNKLDAYKSEVSKMNFAISRTILYKVFEGILNIPIEDIVVLRNRCNKPYINNKNNIKFNISHTDGYVIVGFSKRRIGVDIEKINPNFEFEDILPNCFSPIETKAIGFDTSKFYKYWIAKEAYLKYEGCGLMRSLKEIEVIKVDEQIIRIRDKVKQEIKDLLLVSLASDEYLATVCLQEEL